MVTNKFLIFDEQGRDMMSDVEYNSASQRVSGVVPGLADAEMHNKLYRQTSIMAHAIGRVLTEFGLNAPDNDAATLAANIKSLFCFNVLDAYPVGAIYISASAVSPAQLFGGTWQQISGRFLLAADTSHSAGSTGGSADAIIPYHTHSFTGSTATTSTASVSHNHTYSGSVGSSTHSHGGNITIPNHYHAFGYHSGNNNGRFLSTGNTTANFDTLGQAAYWNGSNGGGATGQATNPNNLVTSYPKETGSKTYSFSISSSGSHNHSYSGTTSTATTSHSHTATINGTNGYVGTSTTGANMPPYLSVYVWKRTA